MDSKKPDICEHCGGDKAIRNPTGTCDHLHYPEYCDVCSGKTKTPAPKTIDKEKTRRWVELKFDGYVPCDLAVQVHMTSSGAKINTVGETDYTCAPFKGQYTQLDCIDKDIVRARRARHVEEYTKTFERLKEITRPLRLLQPEEWREKTQCEEKIKELKGRIASAWNRLDTSASGRAREEEKR